MLTLSIQQPWAWAIFYAGKDVENRSWYTKIRGQFLIHAGKKYDHDGEIYLRQMGYFVPQSDILISSMGGIVGTAKIIDCVTSSDSKWFFGPYGFILRDQQPLIFMPLKGQLGFFEVKYEKYSR